ncbi:MAG: hypothetical protein GX606_05990 [Elusimicrobia bacterium]|nr:hypothetical protein [Elusimicrobiota bacterium]
MRKFFVSVLVIAGLLVVLGFARDALIRSAVIIGAKAVAGVDVKIGAFSMSLIRQSVSIRDFRVYNPEGFPDSAMVDIPEISVRMDAGALLKGLLHVPYMRLDMKEARIIKNKEGITNVASLKFAQAPVQTSSPAKRAPEAAKPQKEMKMMFDLVSLNIGKVIMEDYSGGRQSPKVTVFDVNIKNKEFRNMDNPAVLGTAIMFEALAPAGIEGVLSLGSKTLGSAAGKAGAAVNKVGEAATGLLQGLKGLAE